MSCCTSQLTHSIVASLVWSSPVECLHLNSTSWTALIENLSHCLVSTLKTNFFSLASASLFALSNSTNANFVYWSANTMQNRNPDKDSTLKGPITSVNTLSSFSYAWVSATLGTGVFVILANAHTLHKSSSSPTVSGAFLTTSAWSKWPNRLCHFLALSNFTLLELILNSRTLQGKWNKLFSCVSFTRVPFWSFMQLFPFSKVKLCPHSVHLETDKRFEE